MTALPANAAPNQPLGLQRVARVEGARVLTWDDDMLYASRGYSLLRAKITLAVLPKPAWEKIASFKPVWWRNLSAASRLTARLCRDGFHALAISPSGAMVAAVPGAIITLSPEATEFRITHRITRGTRPLHIIAVPGGQIVWGEYFDNASRDEVHIYASADEGATWNVVYTFPKGAVRHVHNIVHDPWQNCLWVLTGDYSAECRILRATCDFSQVDVLLQGNQQARAVALIPTEDGLYFSSDTPLEANYVHHLDRQGKLSEVASLNASSIYGCRVGQSLFFSTMVEPSAANTDSHVRIYGSHAGQAWHSPLAWRKDRWPMRFFQYGNAFLPDGKNTTEYLALTTVAVESDDMVTSIYSLRA